MQTMQWDANLRKGSRHLLPPTFKTMSATFSCPKLPFAYDLHIEEWLERLTGFPKSTFWDFFGVNSTVPMGSERHGFKVKDQKSFFFQLLFNSHYKHKTTSYVLELFCVVFYI
jgi:hypothetical protein